MTLLPSFPANGVFSLDEREFVPRALDIFRFQYAQNPLYRDFVRSLGAGPESVGRIEDIPFLPVGFFKTCSVRTSEFLPEITFESSGTTGQAQSRHPVKDLDVYKASYRSGFSFFYGPVEGWCIIGLLPAYLERSHSSLVFMVDDLIRLSAHPDSGFYLYDHERLLEVLQRLEAAGQKTLLIGVTFALLDFAEHHQLSLQHTIVMETGGMKGRRREVTREELHAVLRNQLGVPSVHAEYGMTELLSQAYSPGEGLFRCPPWMRVLVRSEDDPLEVASAGNGLVNIIDLANIWSCAFLATDDIGRVRPDGGFEVLGRCDNSDVRGCSLMVGA
ncbi:MAG TPA: acyl transferase [Puia sp.]|nr:acyl transferase [Puia sp.]